MKVNIAEAIKNMDGSLVHQDGGPLTVGMAFFLASTCTIPNAPDSAEDKISFYRLAKEFQKPVDEVEISLEDMVKLKVRCGKAFNIPTYGWLCENIFDK